MREVSELVGQESLHTISLAEGMIHSYQFFFTSLAFSNLAVSPISQ